MVVKYNLVALIAVKGHSDRVKRKNIRPFYDTNLLELKLKQLIKSNSVEKIIVSSENKVVLDIASSFNQIEIHQRDKYYSTSNVSMSDVYKYLANAVNSKNIMWVPVTNPLCGHKIYKKAANQFLKLKDDYDCLLSCIKVQDYLLKKYKPLNFKRTPWQRSQDLEGIHALSFAVNILSKKNMLKWGSLVGKKPYYIELSHNDSLDIDFQDDFDFCEYLFSKNPKKYL